ncbi:MAG: LysR family transcriptional regulator [Lachnospiraceae bacterium]|nr:LysR family transcriptional regulator [Lachnospiraceae bacterium]
MDIEFLREFMVLSKTCSYQEASEKLYITNSTLSKHIQKMETELGYSLFERSTRKVMLTDVGKVLKKNCEQILALYDDALIQMNMEASKASNTLSVAFSSAMSRYGILDLVLNFKKEHPDISIQISEISDSPQYITFINKKADFIFASNLSQFSGDVQSLPLAREELVLFTSTDAPHAGNEKIELSVLENEELILPERAFLQDLFFGECTKAGFIPNVKLYTKIPQTAFQLAENNYACAIYPRSYLNEYNRRDKLCTVSFSPPITFDVYMLYMKKKPLSSIGELFNDYVKEHTHYPELL